MRTRLSSLALLVAAAACLGGTSASAGHEFAIGVGNADQRAPLVSYNSTRGDYLVVWLDVETGALESRAVSQKSGEVSLGKVRRLDVNAFPESLAYNPHRREHTLLSSDGPFRKFKPLRATRFQPNGQARGERLQISTVPGCGEVEDADLVYLPLQKRWLVVWGEANCGFKARLLKGRTLEFDGPELVIERSRYLSFSQPSLAYSSTADEVLLTYRDTDGTIRAIRLDSRGQQLSVGTIAPYTEGVISDPVAIHLPTRDRWLVTWFSDARIKGRFVFADGTLGEVFKVASRFAWSPGAAYNSFADRFLVNWSEGNFGIRGRWYRPTAAPVSRRFRIGDIGAHQPSWSTDNVIACSDRGRHCLVVWERQVSAAGVISDDIYGEIVRAK